LITMNDLSYVLSMMAIILVFGTSLGLLILTNWRWSIITLAIQYIGEFILIGKNWPITLVMVKLVAGWMAGAVIALALSNLPNGYLIGETGTETSEKGVGRSASLSYRILRFFIAGMIGLVIIALAPALMSFIPDLSLEQSYGALFLIGFGMLQLCLTTDVLLVVLGLLTTLSGFEVVYSIVESSSLVTALLATVTLGIALVGAYMLAANSSEVEW
jgi:hypothetical protein